MINHLDKIEPLLFKGDHVRLASMKTLINESDGFANHVMRVVDVSPGGFTPKHSHPWYHVNYFIEGNGELEIDGIITQVSPGSFSFVKENTLHQFRNTGTSLLRFICIVPKEGHKV